MPITYVSGDPLLTQAQVLAFGHNARARAELGTLETRLQDRFPAAFATYRKQCRGDRLKPGAFWVWRESKPGLAFLVIRESSVGATRVRFVETAAMTLARDYRLHGLTSLTIAPLGTSLEWPLLKSILANWFSASTLPVTLYEQYLPGVAAETG
jgi:hypothetical protein